MIKIRVHIYNKNEFMDENVFVEILLPSVPRKGEWLDIGFPNKAILESQAKQSVETAEIYTEWFNGHSAYIEQVAAENLKDLSFGDACIVKDIQFIANKDYVEIEIGR